MVTDYSYSKYWYLLSLIGVLLIVVGICAIASPYFATLASLDVLGYLLIVGGIVQAIYAFATYKTEGFLTHLLLGLFSTLIGLLIAYNPTTVAASITLLLAVLFLTLGLFRVFSAVLTRYENWGWFLFNGIVDLIFGALILSSWPTSGFWVIGLFVGVDFIFVGWTFLMTSFLIKELKIRTNIL